MFSIILYEKERLCDVSNKQFICYCRFFSCNINIVYENYLQKFRNKNKSSKSVLVDLFYFNQLICFCTDVKIDVRTELRIISKQLMAPQLANANAKVNNYPK